MANHWTVLIACLVESNTQKPVLTLCAIARHYLLMKNPAKAQAPQHEHVQHQEAGID